MVDVGGAVEIVVAEPFDHRMRQQDAGLGLAVRGMLHRKVGGGIDQHLAGDGGPSPSRAAIATTAARLPPALSPPTISLCGVDAELLGVVGDPFRRGDGVVDGGGEFVLGREAVIDRDHDQLALVGQLAAHHVMGIEIADHPAAAVKEHQARRETVGLAQLSSACRCARGSRRAGAGIDSGLSDSSSGGSGLHDDAGGQIKVARFRRGAPSRRAAGRPPGMPCRRRRHRDRE